MISELLTLSDKYGLTVVVVLFASYGIWQLFQKLAPDTLKSLLNKARDDQEHRQKMEERQVESRERQTDMQTKYQILNDSWERDKVFTLLEQGESWTREIVEAKLRETLSEIRAIHGLVAQLPNSSNLRDLSDKIDSAATKEQMLELSYVVREQATKLSMLITLMAGKEGENEEK